MRRLIAWIVLVPLGILFLVFALANRELVTVTLDPFSRRDPAMAFTMPLYALIILSLIVGVLLGGIAMSIRIWRWRFAARRAEQENVRLKAEAERRALDERARLSAPAVEGDPTYR